MSTTTTTATTIDRLPAWAYAAAAFALVLLYLMLQDNGAVLANIAPYVHEFTHDGRHALGAPCH